MSHNERDTERWDELVAEGKRARLQHDSANWALGDLAVNVVNTFGERELAAFAEAVEIGYEHLKTCRQLARVYSGASGTRVPELSWSHHLEAAAWPDRKEWLSRAAAEGWTLRDLTEQYASAPSPPPAAQARREADAAEFESMRPALLERFGPDFLRLAGDMVLPLSHLRELLSAPPDEHQLAMAAAWITAAARHEADWAAQSRRPASGGHVSLARYMEIRLASPGAALAAQDQPPKPADPTAAGRTEEPPTPAERVSAQRRIRLELAIADVRAALQRVQALEQLVEADRQAIVAELEEVMSLISRRLQPGG